MKALRILIVEDELITANDLRETLEKAGHTVTALARTFSEAVASVRRQPPDLALIDIHLEGSLADGIATAKELVKLHPMPVIYLTANSENATFQRAKETLPSTYLLKPFRRAELPFQIELAYHHHRVNQSEGHPATEPNDLYLPVDNGLVRVAKSNVVFLEADGSYVKVFLSDLPTPPPHLLSMTLRHLAQFFSTPNFHRLSRSVLINLDYVDRLEYNQVLMKNYPSKPLALPENGRAELMKKLTIVRTQ